MSETEITLESLVGEHVLSGVDFETARVKEWGDRFVDSESVRFCLDGTVYVAIENPDDGCRSSMRSLGISEKPIGNAWAPVRVTASMAFDARGEVNHVLEIRDVTTGGTVLRVGTANTDDYYPWWVAEFDPKALAPNALARGDLRARSQEPKP